MKGLEKKTKLAMLTGILLILVSPVYMYFSHDVEVLQKQYPHLKINKDKSVEIEIKKDGPKTWVGIKNISSYAKWAIIFSEDWSFYDHDGFDVEQIKVAVNDMIEGERFRGASTITQQMVKNIFLRDHPLLWRKFHEIVLAKKVEAVLSKEKILEIYLNCIEYGPGVYGIRAASFHYFQKPPSQLGPRESAFLAMLLPSPKKYYASFKKRNLTKFAQKRVKAVLGKLKMGRVITPEEYDYQLTQRFFWEPYIEVIPETTSEEGTEDGDDEGTDEGPEETPVESVEQKTEPSGEVIQEPTPPEAAPQEEIPSSSTEEI